MARGVQYLVRRTAEYEVRRDDVPEPAKQYAAAFATRRAAEEHVRQLDREAKQALDPAEGNPFYCRDLSDVTSLPPNVLRDWLHDAGIVPPPAAGPREYEVSVWADWWERAAADPAFGPAEWERVWAGLNKHSSFEVEEVDAGQRIDAGGLGVVYAVVHQHWEYDDCNYCGANDGLAVYRTRGRADEEAKRRNADRGTDPRYDHWNGGPNHYVVVELLHQAEGSS